MKLNKGCIRQLTAAVPVTNILFVLGYGNGWVPQVLSWLRYSITLQECALIGSLYFFGRGAGPLLGSILVNRVGRCWTIFLSALLCFCPWIMLLCFDAQVVWVQYTVQVVLGLSSAIYDVAVTIYIGENCSSTMRALFNSLCIGSYMVGTILAYIVGSFCSYETLNALGAGSALLTLLSTVLLREPANYLIVQGRLRQARSNFLWLREGEAREEEIEKEFEEMKDHILEDQNRGEESLWRRISTPEARKSIRIINLLSMFIMMNGFSAIISYFTIVLADSTISSPRTLTIWCGVAEFMLISVCSSLIDKINRRTLLMWSSLISAMVAFTIAYIFTQYPVGGANHTHRQTNFISLVKFFLLTLQVGIYFAAFYPLLSALRGELLPQNIKALIGGVTTCVGSLGSFLVSQAFLPVMSYWGVEYNFYFYGVLSLVTILYVYYDVPETRGKTLVHIQNAMSKRVHPELAPGS